MGAVKPNAHEMALEQEKLEKEKGSADLPNGCVFGLNSEVFWYRVFLAGFFVYDVFNHFHSQMFEYAAIFLCLPCSFLIAFCSNTCDVHCRSRLVWTQ